jgi:hypothetical protein
MTEQEKSVSTPETAGAETAQTEVMTPHAEATALKVEETPEKLVPQSKVNEVVGAAKRDAYEKARKDFEASAMQTQVTHTEGAVNSAPQNVTVPADEIRRIIEEEATRKADEAYANQLVNEFAQKVEIGKSKYNDFEENVAQLNFSENPYLMDWANKMDNSADVLYDLAKNPTKFASILMLAKTNPQMAYKQFGELSKSIKANEEALKQPKSPTPLDQITPSNTGTDNGANTVSDLRKLDSLRG